MKAHTEYMTFNTDERREFVRITENVQSAVDASGVAEGMVLVSAMHITAAVWVNDDEPGLQEDTLEWLDKVAPRAGRSRRTRWRASCCPIPATIATTAAARTTATRISRICWSITRSSCRSPRAASISAPGEAVFYCEFDGRRSKRLVIKVMGD